MVNSLIWYFVHLHSATKFHPCWRIRASKCVQRTIAFYKYKLFTLFLFSVIEFCEVVMFEPWTHYVWSKTGFFFSRDMGNLCTLQCEWINILPRTPSIWFLLDRNVLRLQLHLAESVVRETQKTKRSKFVIFFNLLLVANVYVCSVCIFCGSPSFIGKTNI